MKFIKTIYLHFSRDSLYRNSLYLMINTFVLAIFGFVFWMITARLYTSDQVGFSTTLISLCTLLSSFGLFGINTTVIRYLPSSKNKDTILNTSIGVTVITTVLVTILYLLGLPIFSPKLLTLRTTIISLGFILFMIIYVVNLLLESIFIAYRSSRYVLIKNTLLSITKVILPLFLIGFGAYGIFFSFSLATLVAFLAGFFFLIRTFSFRPKLIFDASIIKHMAGFSLGNYIANFIITFPSLALPLIISNTINYKSSAYFYIDMMIANLLYIIPQATAQSLFAEGSHNIKNLSFYLGKSLRVTYMLMLPAILVTVFFGNSILLAFGKSYSSEGIYFLRVLAVSGVLLIINYLIPIVLKLKHKLFLLISINFVGSGTILLLSWLLVKNGLNGIAIAWVIGQGLMSILYLAACYLIR